MGITVISASSTPVAATASAAGSTGSGEVSTAGFAALLSGQLGNALGLTGGTTATSATTAAKGLDEDEKSEAAQESATDPSLFLIGLPVAPIPVQNNHLPSLDTRIEQSIGAIGEKGSSLSTLAADAGKSAATGLDAAKLAGAALGDGKGNELPQEAANIAGDALNSSTNQNAALLAANANQHKATSEVQGKNEVATPLHAANWAQDFSEKVVWMAKSDQQSAQININPPQLGPVQITLQINGDQASAVLASPHAEVRQALQESLPQLKEMLASAGINLGQADVGANFAQQNREAPFQAANGNRSTGENDILPGIGNTVESTASQPIQRGRGLVDLFA